MRNPANSCFFGLFLIPLIACQKSGGPVGPGNGTPGRLTINNEDSLLALRLTARNEIIAIDSTAGLVKRSAAHRHRLVPGGSLRQSRFFHAGGARTNRDP
jgi:hypothetical protein